MGEGVLYNFVFIEFPYKTVAGDVTAFHRIAQKTRNVNTIMPLAQRRKPAYDQNGGDPGAVA